MFQFIEVLALGSPFPPLEQLPLRVVMIPPPPEHPFNVRNALAELMGNDERTAKVFRIEPLSLEFRDILHYAGEMDALNILLLARVWILQVPASDRDRAAGWAQAIASLGAVVIVVASDEDASAAMSEIYAGIIHSLPFTTIGENAGRFQADVILACSRTADTALSLTPLLQSFIRRGEWTASRIDDIVSRATKVESRAMTSLHRVQRERLANIVKAEPSADPQLLRHRMWELRSTINWAYESAGAIPLADALNYLVSVDDLDTVAASIDALESAVDQAAREAPRVMNANFAHPGGTEVDPLEALQVGAEYELRVDVGPVWDRAKTIVANATDFPSKYVERAGKGGWDVDVVFVSEDFHPRAAAATIFVPESGRSYPVIDERRAENPGPVAIRLRAPQATEARIARGRLSLHYGETVLQSAIIVANVASTAGVQVQEPNRITVDFVLSGPLRDLDQALGDREVGLSLIANHDGGSGHRFIVRSGGDQLPAFIPYDPGAATKQLENARGALLDLFFLKNREAKPTKQPGIQPDAGKALDQFKRDLFVLARLGNRLRAGTLPEALPEDGGPSAEWRRKLAQSLHSKKIIHIARTHSSGYVFPWSLVYQHSLEGNAKDWSYCKVIADQWPGGRRQGPPEDRCPHNLQPDDHINMLCPYGFWGLKHIVEQPVSIAISENGKYDPEKSVPTKIGRASSKLRMAVGVTRDPKLDAALIESHLGALSHLQTLQILDPKAETTDDMLKVLEVPDLVYFLCHGLYDEDEGSVFLGIGPFDEDRKHRIYPSMLDGWTTQQKTPNLGQWTAIRPLVFINGCETMDVTPDQMLSFVSAFSRVPAGGIVGTEVSVQLPVAADFASTFIEQLLARPGTTVGEAMRQARWAMANKGNLIGLAYTMYCMANLQFV